MLGRSGPNAQHGPGHCSGCPGRWTRSHQAADWEPADAGRGGPKGFVKMAKAATVWSCFFLVDVLFK